MVEDYAGHKALFNLGVTELACPAHLRRKFFLHAANGNPVVAEARRRVAQLYALEQQTDKGMRRRRAPGIALGTGQAVARPVPAMARRHPPERSRRQRYRQGHRPRSQALPGVGALRRFRHAAHR